MTKIARQLIISRTIIHLAENPADWRDSDYLNWLRPHLFKLIIQAQNTNEIVSCGSKYGELFSSLALR
jgi:hypothetical protein